MKGNEEVIQVLQDVLCAELTAVNQYFVHARMCENWGYRKLADHIRKEAIEEMQHAEQVIDRILYFDGAPNMQKYMKINVGQTVPQQHEYDLQLERGYNRWLAYGRTKLANLLFAYELQRRLETRHPNVISLACHPGYVATQLQTVAAGAGSLLVSSAAGVVSA